MAVTVIDYTYNIIQSLYYFLNYETYTKNSATQTLKQHFSDPALDIVLGFPPSLQELTLPTIALVMQPISEKQTTSLRDQYDEKIYRFNLHGFCGGEQSFEQNQLQRDKLANDLVTLLEESEYVNIYSVSDPPIANDFITSLTDCEIRNVRCRNLNPTGILIAERYRFLIELEIVYVRSLRNG